MNDVIRNSLDTGEPPLVAVPDSVVDFVDGFLRVRTGNLETTFRPKRTAADHISILHGMILRERQAYAAREAELLDKLARANFFLDCHTTGERGANHCEFDGTHVCTVCHDADLEAELTTLREKLKELLEAAIPFTSGDTVDETSGTIPLMIRLEHAIEVAQAEGGE